MRHARDDPSYNLYGQAAILLVSFGYPKVSSKIYRDCWSSNFASLLSILMSSEHCQNIEGLNTKQCKQMAAGLYAFFGTIGVKKSFVLSADKVCTVNCM